MTVEETRLTNLEILVKEKGSLAAVAAAAKTNPSYLSQIRTRAKSRTGKPRDVGPDLARALEEGCGKPKGWMDVPHRGRHKARDVDPADYYLPVRRVTVSISAGVSGFAVEYENEDAPPLFFRREWFQERGFIPDKLVAIKVNPSTRSMEPGINGGDTLVMNTADVAPVDGEVFAVNYEGELVVKRLKRDAGQWFLVSDNADKRLYPDKVCHEGAAILGRIVHKQSERI